MTVTSGMKLLIAALGVDVPELSIGVPFPVGVSVSIVLIFQSFAVSASYSSRETGVTITMRVLPSGGWRSRVKHVPKAPSWEKRIFAIEKLSAETASSARISDSHEARDGMIEKEQ